MCLPLISSRYVTEEKSLLGAVYRPPLSVSGTEDAAVLQVSRTRGEFGAGIIFTAHPEPFTSQEPQSDPHLQDRKRKRD